MILLNAKLLIYHGLCKKKPLIFVFILKKNCSLYNFCVNLHKKNANISKKAKCQEHGNNRLRQLGEKKNSGTAFPIKLKPGSGKKIKKKQPMKGQGQKLTSGSKIVFAVVSLIDIILANIVYGFLVNSNLIIVPEGLTGDYDRGVICATIAAIIGIMFYGNRIFYQRISIWQVVSRATKMSFCQALVLLALVRLTSGVSQSVLRLTFFYFVTYLAIILVLRFIERLFLNSMRSRGHNKRSVVFIGSDPAILSVYNEMQNSASTAYNILGYYSNQHLEDCPRGLHRLGTRETLMEKISRGETPFQADIVFYSLVSSMDYPNAAKMIDFCDRNVMEFFLVPRIMSTLSVRLTPVQIGGLVFFTNHSNNINRLDNRIIKRTFDIFVASMACLFMLPLIPFVWLMIKIQSPGPLFFCQERTGLNGKTFKMYKFRSMHVNKDADKVQATRNDPRKFPFGEFMRRSNIDELPQFLNVLKGDMSVVGPRPHMLYHTEMYSHIIRKYMVRHFSKPGITGLAQVTGFRGETKEVWQMEERVKKDIWYNENWSFALDVEIVFRTFLQIFKHDENAY